MKMYGEFGQKGTTAWLDAESACVRGLACTLLQFPLIPDFQVPAAPKELLSPTIMRLFVPPMVFGQSYPACKLENIAAKCEKYGIEACPPSEPPQFDFIIVGGTSTSDLFF